MFTLRDSIVIHAPIERCFLLSTSVDIVRLQLDMTPMEGRTSGLVQSGDTIRWEGQRFGMWHTHLSRVTAYDPPRFFQDTMDEGRFAFFQHDHWFEPHPEGTVLRDEVRFALPLGPAGWVVGITILRPLIRRLMRNRFGFLKHLAEGQEWWKYLPREQRPMNDADGNPTDPESISPW